MFGLHGKVLVAGDRESCRGALCEKRTRFFSSWTEPIPAGSGKDPPQDTAEPSCKADSASGKTHLRKGKKHCKGGVKQQSQRKFEINNPADTNIREGAVRRASVTRAEIALQSVEKTEVK